VWVTFDRQELKVCASSRSAECNGQRLRGY